MKKALLSLLVALAAWRPAAGESFGALSAAAARAEKKGERARAIELYTQALRVWKAADKKSPKAKVLSRRAELFAATGAPGKAVKDLAAALVAEPKNAALHHRRGQLFLELGDASSALTDLYRATSLRLDFAEALFDRGRAYERLGEARFAREDYRTACRHGFKKACPAAAALAGAARVQPKSEPAEEAPAAATLGRDIAAPAAPAPPPAQAKSCASLLESCVRGGKTYGDCLRRTKPCGRSDRETSCCPAACAEAFERATRDLSELAAFAQVFQSARPCAP